MGSYSVQEFAALAGVTVRTLHHYDRSGLLQPARRGSARRYVQGDMLRLQQILTLKAIGFSLREIRALLDSPSYDVRRSLQIQREAIDQRIRQLQQVSRALAQTIELLGDEQQVDWAQVATIVRFVGSGDRQEWLRRYFTDEQLAQLVARRPLAAVVQEGERSWTALIDRFRALSHLPPEHPDVQQLAAQMAALVEQFTRGDRGLHASLDAMYRDVEQIPREYRLNDARLQEFMGQAYRIYHERTL